MPKFLFALLLGATTMVPGSGVARDNPLVYEPGTDVPFHEEGVEYDEVGPWTEVKLDELPPYPDDDDLIELPEGSARDNFTYFVDEKNFVITPDKVVHYTVVAESATGARNVFFEGLRCDAALYKVYGYGTTNGKVSAMRNPTWKPVDSSRAQRYRGDMYRYFFCDAIGFPVPRERALEYLATGTTVREDGTRFLGKTPGW